MKMIRSFQFVLVVLLCLPVVHAAGPNPVEINVGFAEACPHMCPYDQHKGFTVDIARAALEPKGWRLSFVALPWARVVAKANAGSLHAAISTGKKESPQLIYPQLELATQEDCFFGRRNDSWTPQGSSSFLERKTIVFKGWVLEDDYKAVLGETGYKRSFEEFSIDENYIERVIQLVIRHRMDAFWSDSTVFKYYAARARNADLVNIKKLGCVSKQNLYIGFSPAHPDLTKRLTKDFDAGMERLRETGELNRILGRYGLSDWRDD